MEIRFCFGCAKETEFINVSANKHVYWYCTECKNGREAKYPKFMNYNNTTMTYRKLMMRIGGH